MQAVWPHSARNPALFHQSQQPIQHRHRDPLALSFRSGPASADTRIETVPIDL